MSSSTSSQRRDGLEPSKSSDSPKNLLKLPQRSAAGSRFGGALLSAGLALFCLSALAFGGAESFTPSKRDAAQCRSKLDKLKTFSENRKPDQTQTVRFTQNEINSYLALDISSQYHPCLKSLVMVFEENRLKATATIDFDLLGMASQKLLPKLISLILSGVHTLAADGRLVARDGKAHFELQQALFDGGALPKPLVEGIISAVGRKQNPPFNPLQPSEMPYEIDKVDVKSGYIVVVQ
jgi:hypothetical protein